MLSQWQSLLTHTYFECHNADFDKMGEFCWGNVYMARYQFKFVGQRKD